MNGLILGIVGQILGIDLQLTATPGYKQVSLSWTPPAEFQSTITDYIIEQSSDEISWTTISDGTNTNTSYTVTGLSDGQLFYFRVAPVIDSTVQSFSFASATTYSPLATGGTISYSNGYFIHTFTSSGTFTLSSATDIEALVVAGGYDGSATAGGDGGQVVTGTESFSASPYSIVVGATNGGTSSISGTSLSASGAGAAGGPTRTGSALINGATGTTSSITGQPITYGSGGSGRATSSTYQSAIPPSGAGRGYYIRNVQTGQYCCNYYQGRCRSYCPIYSTLFYAATSATVYGSGGGGYPEDSGGTGSIKGNGKEGVVIIKYAYS